MRNRSRRVGFVAAVGAVLLAAVPAAAAEPSDTLPGQVGRDSPATGAKARRLLVSSTIDFIDYVFYDTEDGNEEYYPLEVYEQRIKEAAEGGIRKIYLRVNCGGVTIYPTKYSAIFGANDAFAWNDAKRSRRAINTLAKYDPLTETIRLGKKYGMAVWGWENIADEGGVAYYDVPAEFKAAAERLGHLPWLDPHYRKVPQCQAMRNPLLADEARLVEINATARRHPLGRIVLTSADAIEDAVRITADEVSIYTSADNKSFTRYEEPFRFEAGRNDHGRNYVIIDGLSITAPYVKLVHPKYEDDRWSISLRRARGQGELYNTHGEKIHGVWTTITRGRGLLWGVPVTEQTPLDFTNPFCPAAWEAKECQIGFCIGEIAAPLYHVGVVEFNEPEAMKHRLDKFSELVAYDFDGFIFSCRTHSWIFDPENYGYNPPVIEAFRNRFGRAPGTSDEDRAGVFQIRAEGIADYFKRCKAMTGGRPIYLCGERNPTTPGVFEGQHFGPLPWLYERYFADKSIDGVTMYGEFRKELLPLMAGKNIRLGTFREMAWAPLSLDEFAKLLKRLEHDHDIDEIELYELLNLTHKPEYFAKILESAQ